MNINKTKRQLLEEEIVKAIYKYCDKLETIDYEEIHSNYVEHFELSNNDKYFKFDMFVIEVEKQRAIKLEKKLKLEKAKAEALAKEKALAEAKVKVLAQAKTSERR